MTFEQGDRKRQRYLPSQGRSGWRREGQKLSHATMHNTEYNLFRAFAYNTLVVPVPACILNPLFGISFSSIIAAAAMSLSSVSVVGNALRLRRVKI
jgi:Cu+-exporting ATPase